MFSFMLDNIIMLTVCVTNFKCLKNKGSMLQIQHNLEVVLCQLSDCFTFLAAKTNSNDP